MTPARRSRLAGLVAVAVAAAAGLVGLSTGPASAALCSGTGVNVVVDFQGLGGGVQKGCDPKGAGRTADNVFPAAGFRLDYAHAQPGFVCRVQSVPKSDPCQNTSPANATWGLYWSDGKSGTWHYSTSGVGGLKVSSGGFVAFSWQNGKPADPPRASAINPQATSTPTAIEKPSKTPRPTRTAKPAKAPKPTRAATAAATSAAPSRAPAASGGASTSAKSSAAPSTSIESGSASASPAGEPSSTRTAAPEATTQKASSAFAPEEEHSGLPPWIPVSVILVLALAAFGGLWWRNRSDT